MINQIDKIIQEVKDQHPYKEQGNRDSYSSYNEGWSDACDILGEKIKQELKNLEGILTTKIEKWYKKMIKQLNQISTETDEGKLLIAALAKITTESQKDKTPDEVIEQLNKLADKMKF